jgi:branched-chain amino acid transport system permease protein
MRSPFGRSLDGIRQNPRRMRAIGTPVWRRLVVAYGLSAAMAGTAGALEAQTTRAVGLGALSVLASGTVLVMLILGGTRRYYGAFLGASVYVVVQNFAAQIDPFRWMFIIGILLMAVVLFLENGLMGLADVVRRALLAVQRRSGG